MSYSAQLVAVFSDVSPYHRDKIKLPPSVLEEITARDIPYPLLFHIRDKVLYAGVLDFTAEEGFCVLPNEWRHLVDEGEIITIDYIKLPSIESVVIRVNQYHTMTRHLDIRQLIEDELKRHNCLWIHKIVRINDNIECTIEELQPEPIVSCIDTECVLHLQFNEMKPKKKPDVKKYAIKQRYRVFQGEGNKL